VERGLAETGHRNPLKISVRSTLIFAKRAADLIGSLTFACVFVVFIYKITMRYVAGDAIAWADEISIVLFIWMVFWANAFVVEDQRQIRFDLLYRVLPDGGKRAATLTRLAMIGGLFAWALPGIVDYVLFLWRERTPVLQLRLDFVFACFALFAAAIVIRSAAGLAQLLRPSWRRHI
jgi:TRAP-type C4-dicarboxylate transport system permease small subunit